MAKASVKKAAKTSSKPATGKKVAAKKSLSPIDLIEKACESALGKLKQLNIEAQLSSEIEWCLGSYRYDKNPAGLYEMAGRALSTLKTEMTRKTKGVTPKLIGDIEKALAAR